MYHVVVSSKYVDLIIKKSFKDVNKALDYEKKRNNDFIDLGLEAEFYTVSDKTLKDYKEIFTLNLFDKCFNLKSRIERDNKKKEIMIKELENEENVFEVKWISSISYNTMTDLMTEKEREEVIEKLKDKKYRLFLMKEGYYGVGCDINDCRIDFKKIVSKEKLNCVGNKLNIEGVDYDV